MGAMLFRLFFEDCSKNNLCLCCCTQYKFESTWPPVVCRVRQWQGSIDREDIALVEEKSTKSFVSALSPERSLRKTRRRSLSFPVDPPICCPCLSGDIKSTEIVKKSPSPPPT